MKKLEQFINLLREITELAEIESERIHSGQPSKWKADQLDDVVRPEINELLSYALKGKVRFKYGKKQRLLESTYIITDSFTELNTTLLGSKIITLQDLYRSL